MWAASTDHMADQLIRETMIKIHFSQMCVSALRAVILNILFNFCNKDFMKVCVHLLFFLIQIMKNLDTKRIRPMVIQHCGQGMTSRI